MRILIILVIAISLMGCSFKKAYERIENSYLPTSKPFSSDLKVVCTNNHNIFEPGNFRIQFGIFVPSNVQFTKDNCLPFIRHGVIRETDKLPITASMDPSYNRIEVKPFPSSKYIPNLDPEKGAVYVWKTYAGKERVDGTIAYRLIIYKGSKFPLGGDLTRYGDKLTYSYNSHEKLMIHGQEWEFVSFQPRLSPYNKAREAELKAGSVTDAMDFYMTRVGDYSLLVYGRFPDSVVHYPEWFNPRRALLREWVETFKIMPVPDGYVLPSQEEIQTLREKEIQRWKDSEANPVPRPVRVDPEQARRALSAPVR
ncbi:hypothetical protein [Methylobacillus sp. Pita1]|uniref:hypothetical protein n=1 Tax=Methylobacillus sp. Pita1 TaxID=3382642 RepID=UPI0038B568F8